VQAPKFDQTVSLTRDHIIHTIDVERKVNARHAATMSRQRSSAKSKLEPREGASCAKAMTGFPAANDGASCAKAVTDFPAANEVSRYSLASAVKDPSFVLVGHVAPVGVNDGSEDVLHCPHAQISASRSSKQAISFHGTQDVSIIERSANIGGPPGRSKVLDSPVGCEASKSSNAVLSI
jgi:hypothetical protein